MKKLLGILVLGLLLAGCATAPIRGASDSTNSYWAMTNTYTTPTGGTITNHYVLGQPMAQLLQKAAERCRRISPDSKVINFRTTHQGSFFASEMSVHEYDCENAVEKKEVKIVSMIDKAKFTCSSLGFEEGTEKFSDCSLKLYTQSLDLAATKNQKVVIQGQSSGSSSMTIYDPVRDNNALIKRGQGLINGTCTLGDLSTC